MKNLYFLHPIFPNISPSSPLYCSLYSLTLGVGKPTLHMDDLPGGSNILEIKIFGPQQIYFTSRVRMLTRAGAALEIGRLAAPRNWARAAWLVADLCTSWSRAEQVVSIYPGFASLQIFEYKVGRRIKWLHILHSSYSHHRVCRTIWWLPLIHNSMERDTKCPLCKS